MQFFQAKGIKCYQLQSINEAEAFANKIMLFRKIQMDLKCSCWCDEKNSWAFHSFDCGMDRAKRVK